MSCNPTRLELSNTDATTVDVTLTTDPGDGTAVVLEVPGLSISETQNTSGGEVSYTIAARTEDTHSLWDGTIQVGANAPADIVIHIVETSAAQTVGLTVTDADVSYCAPLTGGTGTVTSVGLLMPGGFTVAGTNPITSSGTFEVTSTLDGIIQCDGAGTFSGDAELNDLADVNVAQGAGNDGDLLFYDHAAGAGAKFKGVARSSIALTELDNDLSDSYLMLIEAPTVGKTYTIDGRAATARTVTNYYAKTSSGTCTAVLKNLTDATTIGSITVTSTGASATSLTNTAVDENDRLGLEITIGSATTDLEIVVEYTG